MTVCDQLLRWILNKWKLLNVIFTMVTFPEDTSKKFWNLLYNFNYILILIFVEYKSNPNLRSLFSIFHKINCRKPRVACSATVSRERSPAGSAGVGSEAQRGQTSHPAAPPSQRRHYRRDCASVIQSRCRLLLATDNQFCVRWKIMFVTTDLIYIQQISRLIYK